MTSFYYVCKCISKMYRYIGLGCKTVAIIFQWLIPIKIILVASLLLWHLWSLNYVYHICNLWTIYRIFITSETSMTFVISHVSVYEDCHYWAKYMTIVIIECVRHVTSVTTWHWHWFRGEEVNKHVSMAGEYNWASESVVEWVRWLTGKKLELTNCSSIVSCFGNLTFHLLAYSCI